jgi:hypothetical protein
LRLVLAANARAAAFCRCATSRCCTSRPCMHPNQAANDAVVSVTAHVGPSAL